MTTLSGLQSVHPVAAKDITPFGTWLFHRVTILCAGILSVAPFASLLAQH